MMVPLMMLLIQQSDTTHRLAQQDLQVVVQIQDLGPFARSALVTGHDRVLVVDGDRGGRHLYPDPVADEPGRHAVLAAPHHHLCIPVNPRSEGERGVERLGWQWPQQRSFERPVVPDTAGPVADAPPVVGVVQLLEQRIELVDRRDRGHRDAMGAAEPAAGAT
jgi:hypothetical protein